LNKVTAAEKVRKASAVLTRMMRAMRPLSAPTRSASTDTLLALGRAATSVMTIRANGSIWPPSHTTAEPTENTSSGCSTSLRAATGR